MKSLVDNTKRANKKALTHFDLIQGLKADEYGMEFLIRKVKPDHGMQEQLQYLHRIWTCGVLNNF